MDAVNAPAQEMSFEQFKTVLKGNLTALVGENQASQLMTEYSEDLPRFYAEDWTVAALSPGMIWHFL